MRPGFTKAALLAGLITATSPLAADTYPTFVLSSDAANSRVDFALENGPVRADTATVRLTATATSMKPLIDKLAESRVTTEYEEFYYELREFRSPSFKITVDLLNGERFEEVLPVSTEADFDATVQIPGVFERVYLSFNGQQDFYKCFDASTCVFDSTFDRDISVGHYYSIEIVTHDPILSCGDGLATVERKIGSPTEQRVTVKHNDARGYLGLYDTTSGYGDAAETGDEFVGFSSSLGTFRGYGGDYRTAHVFPTHGGLKIKVDTKPHYFCSYVRTASYPDYLTLAVPIGQRCPDPDGGSWGGHPWRVTSSSGGADQAYSRDWFFQGCEVVPVP